MGVAADDLIGWADYVFERESWHVSLWDAVADLTAVQASWTPAPSRNSIWNIVNHVALWKEEGARRIEGAPPRPPAWEKGVDWQPVHPATDDAWRETLQRLRAAHAAVTAALARHGDEGLKTARGLIAHDSYHCGQICYLRALQGIPVKVW